MRTAEEIRRYLASELAKTEARDRRAGTSVVRDHDAGVTIIRRKHLDYWTEVTRIEGGKSRTTTCCCQAPGGTRKGCQIVKGTKTPCRCVCHAKVK